ncbi:Muskelin 1, intracellular mediator containing kelch motif [Coelomomyces lativittatus]|nr:Muskelin 1, intracellular mediator containing kelch motif [Coelomomyces lativittatus]
MNVFPVEYVKVVPHASFEKEFPYSIWYLELKGVLDEKVVEQFYQEYTKKNFTNSFHSLSLESSIQLEDPVLSQLYKVLVTHADFEGAESMIQKLATNETLSAISLKCFSNTSTYGPSTGAHGWLPRWHEINSKDSFGNTPAKRGGHQLCADPDDGRLYLFGGWDGTKNLNDFWVFDISQSHWTCIAHDTEYEMKGPSPRSCHKMCFDTSRRILYFLGEFLDHDTRLQGISSDFWAYYVDTQKWIKLSGNTVNEQGPPLIYDHQMCIDSERQLIYVFGGRVVTQDQTVHLYSGLFEYNIESRTWRTLRADTTVQDLAPRVGHFMLFYPPFRQLLIFGGQRNKEVYHHFLCFDLETESIMKLPIPEFNDPDLTQRAVYDPTLKAVLLLSNVLSKPHATSHVPYICIYKLEQRTWHKCGMAMSVQPCSRFAHQLSYDPIRKSIYLFGGNPDLKDHTQLRLNDFWELSLQKPDSTTLLRQCLFLIRKQKFLQLCQTNREEALFFLQHEISAVVDHEHTESVKAFSNLALHLFQLEPQFADSFATRNALFDQIASFFPSSLQQPRGNLLELLPLL